MDGRLVSLAVQEIACACSCLAVDLCLVFLVAAAERGLGSAILISLFAACYFCYFSGRFVGWFFRPSLHRYVLSVHSSPVLTVRFLLVPPLDSSPTIGFFVVT
ncbi:hypothetical protein K402DRAFT_77416 [Aulographum hederae CBS 113979]|uniref:Uncharacterized protein n=1 Tax=Aulographum hederae CBS 113979 TaxID=1176131 RepID=A0A6G1HGF4_9PEZI|nr:hypothetical protein K402DRAFT_77416 [Aulographum hederae CBS 113979]